MRRFKDKRGVEYIFDAKVNCGRSCPHTGNTFCIVGPGHSGTHWDGETEWNEERMDKLQGDYINAESA